MIKQIKIFYVFSFLTTLMGFIFIFYYKADVNCSELSSFDNVFEVSTIDEYLKIRRTKRDHLSRENCRTLLFSLVECMVKDKINLTLQNFSLILELGKAGNVEFFAFDSGYSINGKFNDIKRAAFYYRYDDPRGMLNFKILESTFYHLPLTQLDYFYLMMECKKALDLGIDKIDGYDIRGLKIALDICLMDQIDMQQSISIPEPKSSELKFGNMDHKSNYNTSEFFLRGDDNRGPRGTAIDTVKIKTINRNNLDWTALYIIYSKFGFTGLQYIFDGYLINYSLWLYSGDLFGFSMILITIIITPFFISFN